MKRNNKTLYRIIPFYELVQMCEEPRKMILKSPRLWDDNYEGFFYRKLMTIEGLTEAYNFILELFNSKDPDLFAEGNDVSFSINILSKEEKTLFFILRCIITYYLVFCISFTEDEKESDAMWRIYSFDKTSLKVEFDKKKLESLKEIFFLNVDYDDNFDFLKELKETITTRDKKKNLRLFKPLYKKRMAFQHENEVRMVYYHMLQAIPIIGIQQHPDHNSAEKNELLSKSKNCFDENKNFLPEQFLNMISNYLEKFKKETTAEIDLTKENLLTKDLIKSVVVHPQSAEYYVKIIEKYCNRHKINFKSKSKLYDFE